MQLISLVFEALGDVIGGMLVALISAVVFWNVMKLVHHPEWGPVVSLVLVTATLVSTHRAYRMVPIIALFSLVGVICSWPEGATWRRRRGHRDRHFEIPGSSNTRTGPR